MVDDLTLVRLAGDHFWVFPTPSRVDIVTAWLTDHAEDRHAYVTNITSGTAYLSIQGPRSRETLAKLTDLDLSTAAMPYYHAARGIVAEVPALVSRTGYSGELGYELFYPRDYAEHIWDAVIGRRRRVRDRALRSRGAAQRPDGEEVPALRPRSERDDVAARGVARLDGEVRQGRLRRARGAAFGSATRASRAGWSASPSTGRRSCRKPAIS